MPFSAVVSNDQPSLYLDLLKRLLTRTLFPEELLPVEPQTRFRKFASAPLRSAASILGVELVRRVPVQPGQREEGGEWPRTAETMIGIRRLDNIQEAIKTVIAETIPGDWLETGVWRGGASIFARACLAAYGDTSRTVWLADSFQGLPKPSLPQDDGDTLWSAEMLAVSLQTVRRNFETYGLLDDRVKFLPGWFADTLPSAPIEQLAVLRLDGDMYESTMDALVVYPKVSKGGYVIVDDYNAVKGCRLAVEDFRAANGITAALVPIDREAVYWRK